MPQQIINVYDRPTYETEKVKGWDTVRIFKATGLTSEPSGGEFQVSEGSYIIQNFTSSYDSNYKGTNLIDLTKLENFDSIKLKMNGLFIDNGAWFNFDLCVLDNSYNLIQNVRSNYNSKLSSTPESIIWRDWYLDIELTFWIDNGGGYNFVLNGNYSISFDNSESARADVRLIPFNGSFDSIGTNSPVYIDIRPWNGNGSNYIIKSINLDFVE